MDVHHGWTWLQKTQLKVHRLAFFRNAVDDAELEVRASFLSVATTSAEKWQRKVQLNGFLSLVRKACWDADENQSAVKLENNLLSLTLIEMM